MHLQFTRKLIKIIRLFYNDNIIIIRKERRVKKLFEIFVKYTFLSLIVLLKEINLFPNRSKSLFENLISHCYYLFL